MEAVQRHWFVIRTKPNSESLASTTFKRDGHDLFFPKVFTPKTGRADVRLVPLFPGYLFIRSVESRLGWPEIRNLPGILGWVRIGDEVPSIPDSVINDLKRKVEAMNASGGLWKRYQPGDRVTIKSGKLEGLGQVLEEPKSPQARIRVLMEFLGRRIVAKVPWEDILPADNNAIERQRRRAQRRTRGRGRWVRGFGLRVAVPTS